MSNVLASDNSPVLLSQTVRHVILMISLTTPELGSEWMGEDILLVNRQGEDSAEDEEESERGYTVVEEVDKLGELAL